MDVAQSPPLCDRLGEPLGLGERRSLTSAAPAGPSGPLLLFLPTLPFTRQKLQLGSGLLFLLPTLNLSSLQLSCPCTKSPVQTRHLWRENRRIPVLTSGEDTLRHALSSLAMPTLTHKLHTAQPFPAPPQTRRSLWTGPTACMHAFVHPLSLEKPICI